MGIGIIAGGIHPTTIGGAEKQALELAKNLSSRNDVVIYTRFKSNNPNYQKFKLEQINYINIPIFRYFNVIIGTIIRARLYSRKSFSNFCIGTGDMALIGFLLYKIYAMPYIISIRGENSIDNTSYISNLLFSSAKKIHIQSNKLQDKFIEKFPNHKSFVIPNGVTIDKFLERNFSERCFDVIYVGRLVSHDKKKNNDKGVRYLIRSINSIKNISCLIVGDGPDKNYLESISKNKKTIFTGYISPQKVTSYISRSKVLVLPSIHGEGIPNVILEAMSTGTPVVATDCGGTSDIIQNNQTGFIIKSRSSEEISNSVKKLLANKEMWEKFSFNCLQNVKKYYSWEVISNEFESKIKD